VTDNDDPQLDALRRRAQALLDRRRRVVVGVTGAPGSGTTTRALALARRMGEDPAGRLRPGGVLLVPVDGVPLSDRELDRLGRRQRTAAPDPFDGGGCVALLRRLQDDGARTGGTDSPEVIYAPAFERDLEQPIAGSTAVPETARLVITEGNRLLSGGVRAAVRPLLDEVWHLDAPPEVRRRRLVARHEQFGKPPDQPGRASPTSTSATPTSSPPGATAPTSSPHGAPRRQPARVKPCPAPSRGGSRGRT
jgi:pantothenate kinase